MKSISDLFAELNCEFDDKIRVIFDCVFDKFERALIDGLGEKFRSKLFREDVSSLYEFSDFGFLLFSFLFIELFLDDARK